MSAKPKKSSKPKQPKTPAARRVAEKKPEPELMTTPTVPPELAGAEQLLRACAGRLKTSGTASYCRQTASPQ
jgi:hypothetical protein